MSKVSNIKPAITVSEMPWRYLTEHLDTISAMAFGGLKSVLPFRKTGQARAVSHHAKAPSQALLKSYRQWCHAKNKKGVPPHLVCAKLAMPVTAQLTAQSPYPLLSVLNQGVKLQIHDTIREGENIELSGELVDASDDGYRARIESRIQVSTESSPKAMTIEAIAAVVLKKKPSKAKNKQDESVSFETIATWQPAWNEGQTFFWLTGDFNPIHTLPWLARRTQFKGCIMHGYGVLAQAYEALQRCGEAFNEIECRFVRPLPLPGKPLLIKKSQDTVDDNYMAYRVEDNDGVLYQVGRYRLNSKDGK